MPYIKTDSNNKVIRTSTAKQEPSDVWVDSARIGQIYDPNTETCSGIEDLKEQKIIEINQICRQKILSGFQSSALGAQHTYKSDPDYQLNLIGLVTGGTDENFPASTDGGQTYVWTLHTAAQLWQVLQDGKARKQALIAYSNQLSTQVNAATNEAELNAIDIRAGWP